MRRMLLFLLFLALGAADSAFGDLTGVWGFGAFGDLLVPTLGFRKSYTDTYKVGASVNYGLSPRRIAEVEYHYSSWNKGEIEKKTFRRDAQNISSPNARATLRIQGLLANFLIGLRKEGFGGKGGRPYVMFGTGFYEYVPYVRGLLYPQNPSIELLPTREKKRALAVVTGVGALIGLGHHGDLAPGRRFVFAGRPVYPHSRLYIVGRRVEHVPRDQPEWLEDHRHNCNTFYVFTGDREDLSGLRAVVTVEGQTFEARAPAAVLLPQYALHHYRLVEGSGWSFHVNVRGDYEESLAAPREVDAAQVPTPAVEEVYKAARRQGGGHPGRWSFIDGRFARPGIRLTVYQVAGAAHGRIESRRFEGDGASLIIAAPQGTLKAEVRSDGEALQGDSPATIYHPRGTRCAYERVEGAGLIVEAELEKA